MFPSPHTNGLPSFCAQNVFKSPKPTGRRFMKKVPSRSSLDPIGPRLPDRSFDIDGDGMVSPMDFVWANTFDFNGDGFLEDSERDAARQSYQMNYPDGVLELKDWKIVEELVYSNEFNEFKETTTKLLKTEDKNLYAIGLFMAACQAGEIEMLRWLLSMAKIDIETTNRRGQTPLLMAAEFNQWEVVDELITLHDANKQVRDNGGIGLYDIAIRRNVDAVQFLVQSGVSVSRSTYMKIMDIALGSNHFNLAGFLFGGFHARITVKRFIVRLFRLDKKFRHAQSKFQPDDFFNHVREGLEINSTPLPGSLKMSSLFASLADRDPSRRTIFLQYAAYFTERAKWLWEYIPSDVVASLVLELPPSDPKAVDGTPLDIALQSYNSAFVAHPRLNRIVKKWWRPWPISGDTALSSPADLFRTPMVKFYLDGMSFVIFLILFSWLLTKNLALNDHTILLEWVLLFFGFGYFVNEVQQLFGSGLIDYLSEGWNKFDMAICVNVLIIAACRGPIWKDEWFDILNYIYITAMVSTSVLMWVRALFVFSFVPALGPLLITLRKMIIDIINFSILSIVFLFGFYFAFNFIIFGDENFQEGTCEPDEIEGFVSTSQIMLRIFQGGLSGEPTVNFSCLEPDRRLFAEIMASLHVLISGVVLVNLLIAMMGSTYQAVKENSDAEYVFQRVQVRWSYSQSANDTPPPLNLIVFILFIILWPFNYLLDFVCRSDDSINGIKSSHDYCFYCHRNWDDMTSKPHWLAMERFPTLDGLDMHDFDPERSEHVKVASLYNSRVLCSCIRLKKVIRGNRYFLERISVVVFTIFLWLPCILVYGMLWAIKSILVYLRSLINTDKIFFKKDLVVPDDTLGYSEDSVEQLVDPFDAVVVPESFHMTAQAKLDKLLERFNVCLCFFFCLFVYLLSYVGVPCVYICVCVSVVILPVAESVFAVRFL